MSVKIRTCNKIQRLSVKKEGEKQTNSDGLSTPPPHPSGRNNIKGIDIQY